MNEQQIEAATPKRRKLAIDDEPDQNHLPITSSSNEQPPPPSLPNIFKLDIDCMDEIFEYLPLVDLAEFAQTCTAMHKVTGEYFKRNNANTRIAMEEYKPKLVLCYNKDIIHSPIFNHLTTNLGINGRNPEVLLYLALHRNEFKAIKSVTLMKSKLSEQMMDTFDGIFPQLESIRLYGVYVDHFNMELMLQRCNKLKILGVCKLRYHPDPENHSWMRQRYPNLEHFSLRTFDSTAKELMIFLQNNPNIRSILTDSENLLRCKRELIHSNVHLDFLNVFMRNNEIAAMCKLLNQLYGQQFYKRLHIFLTDAFGDPAMLDTLTSAALASLHGFEQLSIKNEDYLQHLPNLPNVKVLNLRIRSNQVELNPIKFINLEHLELSKRVNDESILSFIKDLPKLKILAFFYDNIMTNNEKTSLKLLTLNAERQRVPNAQKVTIYVSDDIFLNTKWTMANGDANVQMIEMKRLVSYKSISPYGHFRI